MVKKVNYALCERVYVPMSEEQQKELIEKILNSLMDAGFEKDNFEIKIGRIIPERKNHKVQVIINNPYVNKHEINELLSSFGTTRPNNLKEEELLLKASYKSGIFDDVSTGYVEELDSIVTDKLQRVHIINKNLRIEYRGYAQKNYYLIQKGDDGKDIHTVYNTDYRQLAKPLFLYGRYGRID